MKNLLKIVSVFTLILVIGILSVIPGFAAEELEINGIKGIKKGDIVTYDLNLADCDEGVVGLQMYMIYDRDYLDIVDNTFDTPNLTGAVSNTQGDYITFNWTDVMNYADFSKKKVIATVDFKVLKGGKTDITYFVSELYGEDMTYLKSYTFTYDLAVNDEIKIDDKTPIITDNKDAQNSYQGSFVNYVDGQGEKNGKNNKNRETVVGETQPVSTLNMEELGEGDESGMPSPSNVYMILAVIAVVLLICAIVVLAIINNARKRNKKEEVKEIKDEKTEDE